MKLSTRKKGRKWCNLTDQWLLILLDICQCLQHTKALEGSREDKKEFSCTVLYSCTAYGRLSKVHHWKSSIRHDILHGNDVYCTGINSVKLGFIKSFMHMFPYINYTFLNNIFQMQCLQKQSKNKNYMPIEKSKFFWPLIK